MVTEQVIFQGQAENLSQIEQVIRKGDLHGEFVSFMLTCVQEGKTSQTIHGYKAKLSMFVKFASDTLHVTDPKQITTYHVRLFLVKKHEDGCNPTTVNNHYRVLHRLFQYLEDEGHIKESPLKNMKPPKRQHYIVTPFSQDQIIRLLAMCNEKTFLGCRNRAIILTFLDSGLRLSELAGIKLVDVKIGQGVIKVMGKGGKERLAPISKTTKNAILNYIRVRNFDSQYLWLTEERKPMTARGVEIMIIRLGKYAGLSGVRCSPHTFRHSFATQAMLNGAPDWAVQQLLGHATLDMTKKYRETINAANALSFYQGNAVNKGFSPVEHMNL